MGHAIVLGVLVVVWGPEATHASAPPAVEAAGECARCHEVETAAAVDHGGHAAELSCESCHSDRRPGRFGRRHRAKPRCTSHHDVTGHPPHAVRRTRRKPTANCLACHDPHGTANAAVVRPRVRTRGRLRKVDFAGPIGAAPGGYTNPDAPGTGLCETCHRHTEFYRADGGGAPHFTDSCTLCHEHAVMFRPVVSDKNCAICHPTEGGRFAKSSKHSTEFLCSDCHAEVEPDPGPGHRATPSCADCHDTATHAPPGVAPFDCTHCHDPHGTDNIKLVLDTIATPAGAERAIEFDNLAGRADGSFASASAPGTGVCEICHTTTRYYRADGSGDPHFTFSCLPCHRHSQGFEPQ